MSISAVQSGGQVPTLTNLASTAVAEALDSDPYSLTWTEPEKIKKEEMPSDQLIMEIMKPIRHVNESLQERIIQRLNICEAKRLALGLKYDVDKAKASIGIAEVQAQIGDVGEARATVKEVKRALEGLNDSAEKVLVFTGIAKVQAQLGDMNEAKATVKKVERLAGVLEEMWNQANGMREVSRLVSQVGEIKSVKRAIEEAERMVALEESQLNESAYSKEEVGLSAEELLGKLAAARVQEDFEGMSSQEIVVEIAKYTKDIVKSPVREDKGRQGQIDALIALTQKQQRQLEDQDDQINRLAKRMRIRAIIERM